MPSSHSFSVSPMQPGKPAGQRAKRLTEPPFRVHESDAFIVSYPKSGNTWLRFLLANMLAPDETISFRNIDQHVIDFTKRVEEMDSIPSPRFIKSHYLWYEHYPRFVYIFRDGRDVMVSDYFYLTARRMYEGNFSDFVRKEPKRKYGCWHDHVLRTVEEIGRRQDSEYLVLQYENMLASPLEAAKKLARFCGLTIDDSAVAGAVEECNFANLQKNEIEHGPVFENDPFTFFRKGTSSQWQEMFSPADLEYYYRVAGEALSRLGYVL